MNARGSLLHIGLAIFLAAACAGPLTPAPSPPSSGGQSQPVPSAAASCSAPRSPIEPPTGEFILAAIALGCEGGAVAAAGGSIWLVPHLDRVALRVDPATNTVAARTSLGDRGPGAEIAASDTMIWASVSSPSFDLERIVRIDPASGTVVASLDLAAGNPVIGAGFVWAGASNFVYRIDPATNAVAASIPVDFACWVTVLVDRVFCFGAGAAEIDLATNRAVPVPGVPNGLPVEAVDGSIWGVNVDSLWAFDPATGKVTGDLKPPTGSAAWGLDAVVVDGSLWASAGVKDGPPNRLVRINREKMAIDCVIDTPVSELGIAAGFGSIWLPVIRQPWLLRIDPAC